MLSEKTDVQKLFEKFESLKNNYHLKGNQKKREDLAILDDTAVLHMWHALCRLFFPNADRQIFTFPLYLDYNSNISSITGIREELMSYNKLENNPYFDCVNQLKTPNSEMIPRIIAIGFYGSSLYGEWLNYWITDPAPKYEFFKSIRFPKDKELPNVYFGMNFLTSIIAHIITVVPTELFYDFYKEQQDDKGLMINFKMTNDTEKSSLNITSNQQFMEVLKNIWPEKNNDHPKYKKENLTKLSVESEMKIPEINLTYSKEFRKKILSEWMGFLDQENGNFDFCLKTIARLAKNRNDIKYIWQVLDIEDNDLRGRIMQDEKNTLNKDEFLTRQTEARNDVLTLDILSNYYYYGFLRKQEFADVIEKIELISHGLQHDKKYKNPLHIINYIKSIQFVDALSYCLNVDEAHFYFPKGGLSSKSELKETPTVFIIIFGKYDPAVLDVINERYKEFIKIYNEKYLQSRFTDALASVDLLIEKVNRDKNKDEKLSDLKEFKFKPDDEKLHRGMNFFGKMKLEYYDKNHKLIENLHKNIPLLLCDHILISCLFAKEFLFDTRIEHTGIEYSFLISNKKSNELIQRKFCLESKNSYKLLYQSVEQNDNVEWPTIQNTEIFDKEDNLYKAIGLLKGHYTLLNKENRIVGILPDDEKPASVKLYNILNLNYTSFQQENIQINKTEILKKITKEIHDVCGIKVSEDGIVVIHNGKVILTYNAMTSEWTEPITMETGNEILKLITTKLQDTPLIQRPKDLEMIKSTIMKISASYSYGAIFVIGNYEGEIERCTTRSFLIEEFSKKNLTEIKEENLFDLSIMDGATIIDSYSSEVHGRITLHPKAGLDAQARDFDIFKINMEELFWDQRGKRYSLGTRHQNALGMAFCTNALIFVISSTGDITAFYRNHDNKVIGYSFDRH